MTLRGLGASTIWGRYTLFVVASDPASKLLDVGDDAALPLRDIAAELARVELGLVGHGAVGRFRVGV